MTKSEYGSPEHMVASSRSTIVLPPMTPSQSSTSSSLYRESTQVISPPSMKAMTPLAMDDALHHSSSTESAQDNAEMMNRAQYPETPKRRPSKIPLAGQKTYVAPKPPTGKVIQQQVRSSSGPASNRSLSKSTGSLTVRYSGPGSITKQSPSPNRSESAQSWRKDVSLEKSHRTSSIPVSAKGTISATSTPTKLVANHTINTSPVLRTKRDSLTTRVKHLDSLSRLQSSQSGASSSSPATALINSSTSSSLASNNNNNSKSSSTTTATTFSTKKDLSSTSNFTNNSSSGSVINAMRSGSNAGERKRTDQPMVPVRRVSSATVARLSHNSNQTLTGSQDSVGPDTSNGSNGPDAAKVRGGFRNSLWNWLKI